LGAFDRRELPDAITSLWKDRYLQRLDLEPFGKDQCVGLIEQALGGPAFSRLPGSLPTDTSSFCSRDRA
jgi:hypothetical protein